MRIWVDVTNSPHVPVFAPLISRLRARGDTVEITARVYAQTLQLLELHELDAEVIGRHGGRSWLGRARSLVSRERALRAWAKGRGFDLALAHASYDLTRTALRLGIPSATMFDYEWAWLQHQLGCRAATKVVVPEAIPPERLKRYGAVPPKLLRYPGLKEEYYLADFEPDPEVPAKPRRGPGAHPRRPAHAARRRALPPAREPALPADARPARPRPVSACGRAPAHRRSARVRPLAPPAVGAATRARRRRPEPDRRRRPRRLGGRDDEPRGGCARRPGLHDLRRAARRRGRGADPRGPPDAALRPGRARAAQARRGDGVAGAPRPAGPARPAALSRGPDVASTSVP